MLGGPKLSNFKIGQSILQNGENRETKTAIKSFFNFYFLLLNLLYSLLCFDFLWKNKYFSTA
jgi:hypothetical protein